MMTNGHSSGNQMGGGYLGGGPPQPMAMQQGVGGGHPAMGQPHIHSNSASGYTTPHDMSSALMTPDLDLPLDLSAFDDFDGIGNLPATHAPSAVTPHTHHYTPQQQGQYPPQHHPLQAPPSSLPMISSGGKSATIFINNLCCI